MAITAPTNLAGSAADTAQSFGNVKQNIPSTPSGADGFFSSIIGGIGEGVGQIAKSAGASVAAALPVWTADSLNLRENNQLIAPDFAETFKNMLKGGTTASPDAGAKFNIPTMPIVLIGGGLIIAYFLFKG